MKIGILTIHNSPSFGGSLQAFALYKYLTDCGYETEIINLLRPANKGYRDSRKHFHLRDGYLKRVCSVLKSFLPLSFNNFDEHSYNTEFDKFNSQIKLSRTFTSVDMLYKEPPAYDVYLTGSDQVWNPAQPYITEPYFLTFVKKGQGKKVSYAASMGLAKLKPSEEKLYKKWLEDYDYISVREQLLKDYLESFVDKKIFQVADPTFLLNRSFWKDISVMPEVNNPYILLFELRYNRELVLFCKRLSVQSGLRLVVLGKRGSTRYNDGYDVVNTAGPRQFLGYIEHAEMIITDSFHGTVFSIIMETKNFYSYISPTNVKGSRITDLLKQHEIEDHLLNPDLKQTWTELSENIIDKKKLDMHYLHLQKISKDFLDNSLK